MLHQLKGTSRCAQISNTAIQRSSWHHPRSATSSHSCLFVPAPTQLGRIQKQLQRQDFREKRSQPCRKSKSSEAERPGKKPGGRRGSTAHADPPVQPFPRPQHLFKASCSCVYRNRIRKLVFIDCGPIHLISSKRRQILRCESRSSAHCSLGDGSPGSWSVETLVTFRWWRKQFAEEPEGA